MADVAPAQVVLDASNVPAAAGGVAPVPAGGAASAASRPVGASAAGGPQPVKTSALYVGDLAPEVSETKLFEIFNAIAPVSSIRVCRDAITRESLGYAYVNFSSAADAERALNELSYQLINGRPCRIMWSQRDPTVRRSNAGNVFVKNLGPEITSKELFDSFKPFGTILSCKVAMDPKGVSKGYGFVHFEHEADAKSAIDVVNGMTWNGRTVVATAYVPRPQRSGPEWTNVFVKNIPKAWTTRNLEELFAPCGDILSSVVMLDTATGASRGYGFVCFKTHEAATKAVEVGNGKDVEGVPATQPPSKAAATAAPAAEDKPAIMKLYVGRAQKKAERERAAREKADAAKRERQTKWNGCNLYVRNLDESMDDDALRREFSAYGSIVSARTERDAEGRSRLFGYVCFSTQEEATKAIAGMHHKIVQGKPLYVQLWQPKEQRDAAMAARATAAPARGMAAPTAAGASMPGGMGPAGVAGMNPLAALYNPAIYASAMQFLQQRSAMPGGAPNQQELAAQMAQMQQLWASLFMNQQRMMASQVRGPAGGVPTGMPAPGGAPRGGMPPTGAAPGAGAAFNPAAMLMSGAFNPMLMQLAAAAGATGGMPPSVAVPGAPGSRGTGRRTGPASPSGVAPGGQRVAAGPARSPTSMPVAGGGMRPGAAAAPARGGVPAGAAGAPASRQGAPAPGMPYRAAVESSGASAAVPPPVAAAPPTGTDFLAQITAAPPEQRKNIIGEALYKKIVVRENSRAGKITGMLLEGMDDAELIHLLEAQAELDARISEALSVLQEHEEAQRGAPRA